MTAPDAATVGAVKAFFAKHGARCELASSEALACHASAQTVASIFRSKVYTFQHKKTGRVVHKIEGDFTFPAALKGARESGAAAASRVARGRLLDLFPRPPPLPRAQAR